MTLRIVSVLTLFLLVVAVVLDGCSPKRSAPSSSSSGKGGSMARFTIKDDFMYTVSDTSLHIFNIKKKHQPEFVGKLKIEWGIETIFSYKDLLFFGTRTGMLIYNIADPEKPVFYSKYQHIYSCDPVVVEEGYAYVTLRNQVGCRRGKNELQVYDIKDPTEPILLKSYQMKNPWGLGIDGKKLFVCDGKFGLKVFDTKDPKNLKLIETLKEINGYDVIPNDKTLIVSARDGIYQFDYRQKRVKMLSRIPVGY